MPPSFFCCLVFCHPFQLCNSTFKNKTRASVPRSGFRHSRAIASRSVHRVSPPTALASSLSCLRRNRIRLTGVGLEAITRWRSVRRGRRRVMHRLAIWHRRDAVGESCAFGRGTRQGQRQEPGRSTAAAFGISLVMVEDGNGDGLPNWNDHVSSTSRRPPGPVVSLHCYQGTSWVLAAAYPASWTFNLAAMSWTAATPLHGDALHDDDGRRTTTLATLAIHIDEYA